ncbi:hypothetical protein [Cellulomonas sp. ES6]|uniref:hypothetical protein n=1 Tax=Cellulomonas sp. ES6 TaxID=3039384 RepID=UPI0024B7A490|nr:hypothetical protein [Cellulomonas sp. ES6]WHP18833.1 hypothetical protein P9841_06870 [Cellulomonas sp. ES6]
MIGPTDLPGLDEDVSRRLIAAARSIAPCLDSLVDELRLDAIAILKGVAAELPAPGTGRVRSQSRNGTSVTWADFQSAFSADDRSSLRALCSTSAATAGSPIGHFPASTVACRIWPPEEYP